MLSGANLIMKDDATRQVVLGLMDQVGRLVKTKFPSCKVVNTGDLLAGKRTGPQSLRYWMLYDSKLDDGSGVHGDTRQATTPWWWPSS